MIKDFITQSPLRLLNHLVFKFNLATNNNPIYIA